MALELKYTEADENSVSTLTEMTGAYNALTNLGGWNTPNEDLTSVTAATASYFFPDAVTYLPSTTSVDINIFPTLPADTAPANLDINFAQLGITEWADGWSQIKIKIEAVDDYYVTIDKLVTCTAEEDLLAFMDDIDFKCCEGSESYVLFNELMAMYNAVILGFCCDKTKSMKLFADLKVRLSRLNDCC